MSRDADVEDDEIEEVEGPKFNRKPTFSTTNSKIGISSVDELVYVYTGQTQAELLLKDQKDVRFSSQRVRPDGVNVIAQNWNALELFSTEKMKSIAQLCYHINQSNVTGEIRDFSAGDGVQDLLNAHLSSDNAVVGISKTSLFINDRRIGDKHATVLESQVKSQDYEHLLITPSGKCAVANSQGDISLFNKIGNRALNKLPGCGYSLIGMSIDKDEHFIVATTTNKLFIYNLYGKEGEWGFKTQIKAQNRYPPVIVTIPPKLKAKIGLKQLVPAFISRGRVVSGSQKYLLVWNLQDMIQGNSSRLAYVPLKQVVVGGGQLGDKLVVATKDQWKSIEQLK